MTREEFTRRIESGIGRPRSEIRKLYPKIPIIAKFILDKNLALPERIFEQVIKPNNPPGNVYKPPFNQVTFSWSGRNGEVRATFYREFAAFWIEPNWGRRRGASLNVPCKGANLIKSLHWLDCPFVERTVPNYD